MALGVRGAPPRKPRTPPPSSSGLNRVEQVATAKRPVTSDSMHRLPPVPQVSRSFTFFVVDFIPKRKRDDVRGQRDDGGFR